MDTEELKKALTPQSMAELDKIKEQGGLMESDAKLVQKGFFDARNAFIERFKTPANYIALPDAQRRAYMKSIEDRVWKIQNDDKTPGHLHIAVGAAVFCKELEQLPSGHLTVFLPEE
jgi:hypothetical protein